MKIHSSGRGLPVKDLSVYEDNDEVSTVVAMFDAHQMIGVKLVPTKTEGKQPLKS